MCQKTDLKTDNRTTRTARLPEQSSNRIHSKTCCGSLIIVSFDLVFFSIVTKYHPDETFAPSLLHATTEVGWSLIITITDNDNNGRGVLLWKCFDGIINKVVVLRYKKFSSDS